MTNKLSIFALSFSLLATLGLSAAPVLAFDGSQPLYLAQADTSEAASDVASETESVTEEDKTPPRPLTAVEAWKHPLGDMRQGNPDSPVILIEYLSLTCPACGSFHSQSYDYLIDNYVKTGKINYIIRELPLDQIALAGAALVRCAPEESQPKIVSMILKRQNEWLNEPNPYNALANFLGQAGYTKAEINKCLKRGELIKGISASKNAAGRLFGATGTPSFYINGERVGTVMSPAVIDEKLQPLLKEYGIE